MRGLARKILCIWLGQQSLGSIAIAEPTEPSQIVSERSFPAEFFAPFAPRTAKEMLDRVPGFVADEVADSRGLGQASSNILINGARSSGKRDSALQMLARVPAESVLRIVIRDGARLGIPGLSGDVADVIISDSETRGTWSWRTHQRRRMDPVWWRGDISLSGSQGALGWTVNLQNKPDRFGHWGVEEVRGPDGVLRETRDEYASYNFERPGGSLALSWTPESGAIGNFSASYQQDREDTDEDSLRIPVSGASSTRYLDTDENTWLAELSADYTNTALGGRLKLIGYQRFERLPVRSEIVILSDRERVLQREVFQRDSNAGESIIRGEFSRAMGENNWQFAFEGAFNFIDATSRFFTSQDGGELQRIPLNNASARVEERRFDASISLSRPLGASTHLQLLLGAEFSQLEQTGEAGLSREFTRPKGFLTISHEFTPERQVSVKLEREVGQLDFFDFISSVNLDAQNSASGNPQLVVPQTWWLDLKLEQSFLDYGELSLQLWLADVEDIVDRVPVGAGEAAGNLDSARRYGASWTSTTYLHRFGWDGAQLELQYTLERSELADPLTGIKRRINDDYISSFYTELRHDVPNTQWAWGLNHRLDVKSDTYRLDEVQFGANTLGETRFFVELKQFKGMKFSFLLRNLFNTKDHLRRTFYAGRRDGDISRVEERFRRWGPVAEFQVEGGF